MFDLNDELKGASTVGICGHVRPDGDCIGSCLALGQYLRKNYPELEITVYAGDFQDSFRFLEGASLLVQDFSEDKSFDVFFALDCGDEDRLGDAVKYFKHAGKTICVDHHISNRGMAMVDLIEPEASSTCELVYQLMDPERIDRPIAEALYMGMVHDTGVFQYSNTTERTMRIAGELMTKGIDYSRIVDDTFNVKTYAQNQILGKALLESMRVMDGKVIYSVVRLKEMKFYNVTHKDLDGIVQQLRMTRGVEAAIFLSETGLQEYKVSMRSNGKIDVSRIASYFGGGGHIRAAGCTMQGSVHDVVNNLTEHMEAQLLALEEKQVKV